jgi:hypothetical protein
VQDPLRQLPTDIATPALPAGASGGGPFAEAAGKAVQGVGRTGMELLLQMKKEGDELAVLEANNSLTRKRIDYTTEALKTQGKASLGAYENYSAALGKDAQELSKDMNATQAIAFNAKVADHDIAMKSQFEAHTSKEMHLYRNNEITAGLQVNQEDYRLSLRTELSKLPAAERAQAAIAMSIDAEKKTRAFNTRFEEYNAGLPPEQLALRREGEISSLHANAMRELVNNKMHSEAKAYFGVYKGALRGKDADSIPDMIAGEAARGNAEVIGDGIFGEQSLAASKNKTPMSLSSLHSAVDEEAKKQDLPTEERKHLRSYTDMLWERQQGAIKADQDAMLAYGASFVAKAPQGASIHNMGLKPDFIAGLLPSTRHALEGMMVERGVPQNYNDFVTLSSDDQAMSKVIAEGGTVAVRNMINEIPIQGGYRRAAEDRWIAIQGGGKDAAAMFSDDKVLSAAIQQFGPDALKRSPEKMSNGDKTLMAAIQLNAAQLTADWNAKNPGKKLGQDVKQQVELYKQAIKGTIASYPGEYFGVTEKRFDLMTPEQQAQAGLPFNASVADPKLAPYFRGVIDRAKELNPNLKGLADIDIVRDAATRRRVERAALYLQRNPRSWNKTELDRIILPTQ